MIYTSKTYSFNNPSFYLTIESCNLTFDQTDPTIQKFKLVRQNFDFTCIRQNLNQIIGNTGRKYTGNHFQDLDFSLIRPFCPLQPDAVNMKRVFL